jgi:hypothetical protein
MTRFPSRRSNAVNAATKHAWLEWTTINTALWVIIGLTLWRLTYSDVALEGQAGMSLALFLLTLGAQLHLTQRQAPTLTEEQRAKVLWCGNAIVMAAALPLAYFGTDQLVSLLSAQHITLTVPLFVLSWSFASSALAGLAFVWALRRAN